MVSPNVESDFGTLKDDLAKLRADIAALSASLKTATSDSVREQVEHIRGRIDRLSGEARTHGRETLDSLTDRIEERPLASILMAFGVGVLIGRLLDR